MGNFREKLIQAAQDAVKAGEISRLDAFRIRLHTLRPEVCARLENEVAGEMQAAGVPLTMGADGFDWSQLLTTLREWLPAILEVLKLFSIL